MLPMIKYIDKNVTVIIIVFHMSKEGNERSSMPMDIENTKKTQTGILEIKTASIIF